ncbi:MAG: DUF5696 domain-containing protein [Clostridia bacterium]|nr:DUF5696 domain-containing protein [Clostridia bacterium]
MSRYYAYTDAGKRLAFETRKEGKHVFLTLKKELFADADKISLLPELSQAKAGDEGYYIMPRNIEMRGDFQVFFTRRDDGETEYSHPVLSLYGVKKPGFCCLIRVERNYKFSYRIAVKDNIYTITPVVDFTKPDTDPPYDDIRLEVIELPQGAGYAEMARTEREIRLERGEITPLRKKMERPVVADAVRGPLIRIRMGWKQSPSPVFHQTPENEPPMRVACTFARVRDIADELKKQGIEHADLQLVGWNKSGHDGRFPQLFPVDERLGGEEELKKTIQYVQQLGYRISTHTNWIDCVEVADTFTWDDVAQDKNGQYLQIGHYSGGYAYHVCLEKQWKNALREEPKVAALGENGIHFTDVISIVEPDTCNAPAHPCYTKDAIKTAQRIMHLNSVIYNSFSSEGAMDFAVPYLDYALYVTFGDGFGHREYPFHDRYLPFWEMIYHGILLYNPTSPTVNFTIKEPEARLTFIMRGGRPSFYVFSKFREGAANWMGTVDLTSDTDEHLTESVKAIRKGMDLYQPIADKQLCYMMDYTFEKDGIQVAHYSDGSRIAGNFSDSRQQYEGNELEPYGYVVLQ